MFVGLVRNQKVITVIRCFMLKYVNVIIVIDHLSSRPQVGALPPVPPTALWFASKAEELERRAVVLIGEWDLMMMMILL